MSSHIQPIRTDPEVGHQIFPELGCFVVTVHGAATGRHMARALCALFESQPELAGYDLIEDLTSFNGDASHADVKVIAECYAGRQVKDGTTKYTVIATPDANYRFWVPAMDHFFPDRRHLVAPTLPNAWMQLNALRNRESAALPD